MFVFNSLGEGFISLAIALSTLTIIYFKWTYQHWKRKGLPYLEPTIPFGNIDSPLTRKENIGITLKKYYDYMKSKGWRHGGLYFIATPQYMVLDLDYVKNIMAKDFQQFTDRGIYYNEKNDPLSGHLFFLGGVTWKNLRTKLSPTFTSGKMKTMFHSLVECTPFLLSKVEDHVKKDLSIDIKEVLGCFTTDVIGSCAFGLECNTFKEDNSHFRVYGKKVFTSTKLRMLKESLAVNFPEVAKFFSVTITPKDISEFFIKLVKDTVQYREQNNVTRKDFLQLLIDIKNNSARNNCQHNSDTLTIEKLAAQCFVFFVAGFETSSTTMTFALYELSKRQDLQEKVREEVNKVLARYDGEVTYESVQEMKYMEQVIDETLRKYPPLPFLSRKCVKDYKIPNENLVIEKGVRVIVPILGIHHDEEYYPEPEKFDPERFSAENKHSRHPYAHIPFGQGPRICIGRRFGVVQSKVGLAVLLKNYRFTVDKKTQEPLKMKVNSFILAAEGEIWLKAEKL